MAKSTVLAHEHLLVFFYFGSNPYDFYCLAPYKGPVEPAIALGGYAKPEAGESVNYRQSKGIILTFLINNYKDKTLLQPAMEWEKK